MSFRKSIIYFFFGGFLSSTEHIFVHVLGICFEGVRDYLLLLNCCCCVLCLEQNLLSVQLVSCACIDWIRCLLLLEFFFFLVFLLVWVFFMGSGLFLFNSRHLGVFP